MNDLIKIAESDEYTYLEKVATIVDEFAAGNIAGEDADVLASEVGIDPEDLLSIFNASYNEDGMEKTASADEAGEHLVKVAEDADSTYLEKCAAIADAFAAGSVTGEEGDEIAQELGLEPGDVSDIFTAAYGEVEMEKTAADDSLEYLMKVAELDGTYLEKCAGIADAYMSDAIDADEASDISYELGVDAQDVDNVITAAYGEDSLDKEAGVKATVGKIKDILTGNQSGRHAVSSTKPGEVSSGMAQKIKDFVSKRQGKGTASERQARSVKSSLKGQKNKEAIYDKQTRNARILAGGGTAAAVGGGTYAATRD